MTDTAQSSPAPRGPGFFRTTYDFLRSDNIVARVIVLAMLMLLLKIPLGMIGGMVTDRQNYESEAVRSVTDSWGQAQTFVGPTMRFAYRVPTEKDQPLHCLTLLPERLSIDGDATPQQRRRGLFAVIVYGASLDVVAEFDTRAVKALASDGRTIDWSSAQLMLGLADPKSIDVARSEIDGQPLQWASTSENASLAALQAPLAAANVENRDTFTVRLHVVFDGSHTLSFAPIGRRSDVTIASSWPSPSFTGRYLPHSQTVDAKGFRASWTVPALGRRYGQLWDRINPPVQMVMDSRFGVSLIDPVDAYRETDRAIKYAGMIIGLTFTLCLVFELATGIRPSVAQYGLIGLSLCVFYLLLLSFSERIGFARPPTRSARPPLSCRQPSTTGSCIAGR